MRRHQSLWLPGSLTGSLLLRQRRPPAMSRWAKELSGGQSSAGISAAAGAFAKASCPILRISARAGRANLLAKASPKGRGQSLLQREETAWIRLLREELCGGEKACVTLRPGRPWFPSCQGREIDDGLWEKRCSACPEAIGEDEAAFIVGVVHFHSDA